MGKLGSMATDQLSRVAGKYASDFLRELGLGGEVDPKCEWSCLLWLKEYWAAQAQKAKINLQQTKERLTDSPENFETIQALFMDSQFQNTVAQVYSKLFDSTEQSCSVKKFASCPFMVQRQDFLERGLLANTFVTILQKATFFAMLERHPLDSGLIHEEYPDVYGVDLTNFQDLERSLRDGRFEKMLAAVVKRASQLAGIKTESLI